MTETPGEDTPPFPADEIEGLARDWITLCQSELASLAGDREAQEVWLRVLALWAGAATTLLAAMPAAPPARRPHERPARAAPEARPAPAAVAPDAGDAALERLYDRLTRLEERLAALERGSRSAGGAPQSRPRRLRRGGIPPRGAG